MGACLCENEYHIAIWKSCKIIPINDGKCMEITNCRSNFCSIESGPEKKQQHENMLGSENWIGLILLSGCIKACIK